MLHEDFVERPFQNAFSSADRRPSGPTERRPSGPTTLEPAAPPAVLADDDGAAPTTLAELSGLVPTRVRVVEGVPIPPWKEVAFAKGRPGYFFAKRLLDCSLALLGLTLAAPILLLVALLVKLTSPGPVIFRQERVGFHGRRFRLYKFRSMYVDTDERLHRAAYEQFLRGERATGKVSGGLAAEQAGTASDNPAEAAAPQSLKHKRSGVPRDPRVTPLGYFLRRSSIDELPQLFNVLRGEMSLVGPRPPIPYEVSLYQEWHLGRLDTLPGLTGLWQVHGRSRVTFDEMVRMDIAYIQKQSFWYDVKLILLTIPAVLSRKGAY